MQYAHAPQNQLPVSAAWVYINLSSRNRLVGMDWIPFADDTFWVRLMSFATTILYVAPQQVFIFVHIKCTTA
jgi:hypothetical protein